MLNKIKESINIKPYFETPNGLLYNSDCLKILPQIPENSIQLCLTDPPYGIQRDKGFGKDEGFRGFGKPVYRRNYNDDWDGKRPPKAFFDLIIQTKLTMIFGGNFFADILPQSTHWIFWDKLNTMPSFGDGELIWTNSKRKSIKKITYEYNGLLGKEGKRVHPTQKPVGLFVLILEERSKSTDLICDPMIGSGTTAIAAEKLNRRWVGIEIEEKYCKIAKERIERELQQRKLPGY